MIPFTKMHGIGNDYLYLDAFRHPKLATISDLPGLAVRMSDRHCGVGSDGLILVSPPTEAGKRDGADARMRMFNADGSEGEMCGNGVRCVAKLVVDRQHAALRDGRVHIETGAGVLPISVEIRDGGVRTATVDMGEPILTPSKIPVLTEKIERFAKRGDAEEFLVGDIHGVFVSMGNPHFVSFFDEMPTDAFLSRTGPQLERHEAFPNRMNVHFVRVDEPTRATMVTWERGSGPTLACGTGACAVLVAGVLTGRLMRESTLRLPGGSLSIRWDDKTNHVFMTGPAVEIFSGEWPEEPR